MRINNIHNFIFKIIYKDEEKDDMYKTVIYLYIIYILSFSSALNHLLYYLIKNYFNLVDFIEIEIDRNLIRNNNISNDTINAERLNINKYINHDINNKNNKNNKKEEIKSPELLIINNKNEINNNIKKPKAAIEYPNPLNINKKFGVENNEIKFTERIDLNIININKKNEISNDINEPKEIPEYPNLLKINKKYEIEDDK